MAKFSTFGVADNTHPLILVGLQQGVTLRTFSGRPVDQFGPRDMLSVKWTRELRDVSSCELAIPSNLSYGQLSTVTPWLHWVDVWDVPASKLLWSGPVQKVVTDRDKITVTAKDVAALADRTRNPLTKSWDAVDPSTVAAELWSEMIEAHHLEIAPVVRPDPEGERYAFKTTACVTCDRSIMHSAGLR